MRRLNEKLQDEETKLIKMLLYPYLAHCYLNDNTYDPRRIKAQYMILVRYLEKRRLITHDKAKETWFRRLDCAVYAHCVIATEFEQIHSGLFGWCLQGAGPEKALGGISIRDLKGKSTLIYAHLEEKEVKVIERTLKETENSKYPTRVTVATKNCNYKKERSINGIVIYKDRTWTLEMVENNVSKRILPCDTTTLNKNYDYKYYYSKGSLDKMCGCEKYVKTITNIRKREPYDIHGVGRIMETSSNTFKAHSNDFVNIIRGCRLENAYYKSMRKIYFRRKEGWRTVTGSRKL